VHGRYSGPGCKREYNFASRRTYKELEPKVGKHVLGAVATEVRQPELDRVPEALALDRMREAIELLSPLTEARSGFRLRFETEAHADLGGTSGYVYFERAHPEVSLACEVEETSATPAASSLEPLLGKSLP
jgi:hypothetical protein